MVTHVDDKGFVYFLTVGGHAAGRAPRPARRGRDARRAGPGRDRAQGRQAAQGRREAASSSSTSDLHIDVGARDRGEALGCLQIGDVGRDRGRAGRAGRRAAGLSLARQPARRLRRARGGQAGRGGRRRAGRRRRGGGRAGRGRRLRGRAHDASSRSSRRSRSRSTSPARPTSPTATRRSTARPSSAAARSSTAARPSTRRSSSCSSTTAEAEGIALHGQRLGRRHPHRHGRGVREPRRGRDRADLAGDALHPHAGRGGLAGRRRGDRAARCGFRAAARARASTSLARVFRDVPLGDRLRRPHAFRQARRRASPGTRRPSSGRSRSAARSTGPASRTTRSSTRSWARCCRAAPARRPRARRPSARACRSSCPRTRSTRSARPRSARSRSPTR